MGELEYRGFKITYDFLPEQDVFVATNVPISGLVIEPAITIETFKRNFRRAVDNFVLNFSFRYAPVRMFQEVWFVLDDIMIEDGEQNKYTVSKSIITGLSAFGFFSPSDGGMSLNDVGLYIEFSNILKNVFYSKEEAQRAIKENRVSFGD